MKGTARMRVGVDFDNTIVCYDGVFHRVAVEQKLVPPDLPRTKGAVRDHLRKIDREDDWTKLQGYVYGARMDDAEMFPGALDFFHKCRTWGVPVLIISHKTRTPYLGPHYDLHASAQAWLRHKGFYDAERTGLTPDRVVFELTKEGKLQRIGDMGCAVFLDDLPEFLLEPAFPKGVERVLFDPTGAQAPAPGLTPVASWGAFADLVRRKGRPDE